MALMDAIFALTDVAPTTASLNATTSTAEISLGADTLWQFVATQNMHIRVGTTGMGAASASYTLIPANTLYFLYMNRNLTHIRIFNNGSVAGNYFLTPMYKA